MSQHEYGTVKMFNSTKGFGFLTVVDAAGMPTKEEIFFHISTGRSSMGYRMAAPKAGDKVRFLRVTDNKGRVKASEWLYASDYESTQQPVSVAPTYRVSIVMHFDGRELVNHVIGEYVNVEQLTAAHPILRSAGAYHDTLPYYDINGAEVIYNFDQRNNSTSEWEPCDDPRPEPVKLTIVV